MSYHPNLRPSTRGLKVLGAVSEAVQRTHESGEKLPFDAPQVLHAESATLLETLFTFTVAFDGYCRQYWVTTAGFIGVRTRDQEHLIPLNLNDCDAYELDGMFEELQRVATGALA